MEQGKVEKGKVEHSKLKHWFHFAQTTLFHFAQKQNNRKTQFIQQCAKINESFDYLLMAKLPYFQRICMVTNCDVQAWLYRLIQYGKYYNGNIEIFFCHFT